MKRITLLTTSCILLLASAACSADKTLVDTGYGPHPILPAETHDTIPTVNTAKAVGWKDGGKPTAPAGFNVTAYAADLDHPRWLYVLPNGDVLVAETNSPAKPDDAKGITGFFMKLTMKRAGAGPKSANRITLLRGIDANGVAQEKTIFLSNLNSPYGMALVGNDFYVADSDALLKFPYHSGDTHITEPAVKVADLPAGTINHHWTKNVIASPDGKTLYVTVGSNSNVAENGIEAETNRAAILAIDPATGKSSVFASGLRNPNGMDWQPQSHALWVAVNERDELGDNLVPDYMTSVRQGDFFGWPYSYYGQHVDERVKPQNPDMVANAIAPDYALGNHTASLGLKFYTASAFPKHYRNGVFIGQHGSWNRKPKNGYKVVFVPFDHGKPAADKPEDFLTGFLDADEKALGRPVGVVVDQQGALLVADDVGNRIWRVTATGQ